MMIFGPIPSRRLGRSLGINNIPPKYCSYSCIYCQVGRTNKMQIERRPFYDPGEIKDEMKKIVTDLKKRGEKIDYLTFVADGEPTLDINLGQMISMLKVFGIKIAVITNASLIWQEEVRNELAGADWISLKCDAVTEDIWHRIDRPHGKLDHDLILDGMRKFASSYNGNLVTETMLINNNNDSSHELERIATFLRELNPKVSYISIPTRPPAEESVLPADPEMVNLAYQIFRSEGLYVECLLGYEGNDFSSTGNLKKDLLNITAVHPMKEEAVRELMVKCNADWSDVEDLLKKKKLIRLNYAGDTFYVRNHQV